MAKAKKKASPKKTKGKVKGQTGKTSPSPAIKVNVLPMSDDEAAGANLTMMNMLAHKYDPAKLSALSAAELEQVAREVIASGQQYDVARSLVLYLVESKHIAVDHGWDPKDYYEKNLGISKHRADAYIATWKMLVTLGIDTFKRLAGLSWEKLKVLRKAVEAGKINKRNLETWLKKCLLTESLPIYLLEKEVKGLIGKSAKEDMDTSLVNIQFKIPAYDAQTVNIFEDIASQVLKTDNRGVMFLKALLDFSANYADARDSAWWKSAGIMTMKEMMERVAPVAVVLVPLVKTIDTSAGKLPVPTLFQAYGTQDKDAPRELTYCLAASETEARKTLKPRGELRTCKWFLGDDLMPKTPFTEIGAEEPDAALDTLAAENLLEADTEAAGADKRTASAVDDDPFADDGDSQEGVQPDPFAEDTEEPDQYKAKLTEQTKRLSASLGVKAAKKKYESIKTKLEKKGLVGVPLLKELVACLMKL